MDTAPGIKGATASAQVKPATLETGLVVQVPPFVNTGDLGSRQHRDRRVPVARLAQSPINGLVVSDGRRQTARPGLD